MILRALLLLAPHLSPATAAQYAQHVSRAARAAHVPPLLLVALVHRESRWRRLARSGRGDVGLCQLRARYARLDGAALLRPGPHLRECARQLAAWRRWHRRRCRGGHHYSQHMQWGRVVRGRGGRRVAALWRRLRR